MPNITIGVGHWECSERERSLINTVLSGGRLSYGAMSKRLEHDFAAYHNSRYGVLSNSGTSSLQVAVQAMKELHGWKDGSEIIVPAVTFVATANVVIHNKMIPVPVDVRKDTYNLDYGLIDRAISDDTVAIMPVHLFGQPAQTFDFYGQDIKVIADSAECMGATLNGHKLGELADITCFSFYVAHLLTTGVGGMGVTNNPDYAAKMRSLVNHGRDGIFFNQENSRTSEVVSRRFKFDSIGHSFRITELEAALGIAQMETLDEMIATRQKNAAYLTSQLEHLGDYLQLPSTAYNATHSWMMYPIVLKKETKWDLCERLEEAGIETREMLPLINQPCYADFNWVEDDYPVAQWINSSGFYVGCHQYLERYDLDMIAEVIDDHFKGEK